MTGPAYDASANTMMLFQVVFMETAGYIIVGSICERITFGAFLLCELFVGALLYPIWYMMFGKPDVTMACNGMLAGLVAITAPCAFVSATSAVIIGAIAGALVCGGVLFNERVLKVDDPCGAVSVHGFCGWFGAVAVGIFADGSYGAGWNGVGAASYLGVAGRGVTGLLHGDTSQFLVQLGGATLCAVYAFGLTFAVFKVVNAVKSMRVSREVELEGLDLPEFGMEAYPDGEPEVSTI